MDNIQDLKEAEWAFNIFEKCIPEQYRKASIVVLVGKYSDRTPSEKTFSKILKLHEQWLLDKDNKNNTFKDFSSYARYYFNSI